MNWKGKVSKVSKRDWGTKTIYSWQVEGTNQWFRSEMHPDLLIGEWISCNGDSAQKITEVNLISEDLVKLAAESGQSQDLSASSEAPPTNSADYWRWKQMRDQSMEAQFKWRDARSDATRIICAALDNSVLALGNAQGKKLGLIKGYVNELTRELLEDMTNERSN